MASRPSLSGAGCKAWGDRVIRWAGGPVDKRMIVELVIGVGLGGVHPSQWYPRKIVNKRIIYKIKESY